MKILENLTKWQNYTHYLLLTGAVFYIHHLSDITGVEANAITLGGFSWVILFLFYAVGILIADTIIHLIFASLPKPYQWKD